MTKYKIIIWSSFLTPFLAFAAPETADVEGVIRVIGEIISSLIPIVVALALLYFLWGLAQFIYKSGDSSAQEEGKNKMIWGIIALFVMVSVWGIVRVIGQTLFGGINSDAIPIENIVPGSSGSNNPLGN
jgi:uncharacterized membrane-anchored protein